MKSVKLFFLAAMIFSGFGINAQTADEVVDKYVTAMGGKDKLASLNTVKMTGTMSVQGTDISMTMTKSHMIGLRMDIEVMGTSNYQLGNDKEGWVFMPVQGMASPVQMDEEQYKSFATQLDVQGSLFNYKEKGTTVELLGNEKVEGADAHKLKVTYKSGKTSTFFIDAKTGYLIKTASKSNFGGQEVEVENTFSDFKQNADGYTFPYTNTSMQGTISFDKIETNIKVDDSIYKN